MRMYGEDLAAIEEKGEALRFAKVDSAKLCITANLC
jgi:hypothetical protein